MSLVQEYTHTLSHTQLCNATVLSESFLNMQSTAPLHCGTVQLVLLIISSSLSTRH